MNLPTAQPTSNHLDLLGDVEVLMKRVCTDDAPTSSPVVKALHYHLDSDGGRSRANLATVAGSALGLPLHEATALACTVELLHNASLVQDDLQDRCPRRRNREAVWKKFGSDCALGLTDLLISGAYGSLAQLTSGHAVPALLRQTHWAVSQTIHGQAADLGDTNDNVDSILQVARCKSGYLFALALELPLIAAGHNDRLADAGSAARNFGVGYQIYDDLLDAESDRASGIGANVVLALEAGCSPAEARAQACRLSLQHLEHARQLSESLPAGSGAGLAVLVSRLENKIGGLSHE